MAIVTGAYLCVIADGIKAADHTVPMPDALGPMSEAQIANAFLGDWRDERNRWWFAIDEIESSTVRRARFRLAELKEGRINGTSLWLVSRSCIGIFGCYEYYIEAELISSDQLDMTATTDTCNFESRCRESGEVVHYILTRDR